ncbi:MAG TPA: hypothetical protein PK006_10650 [Saprospiraceae bacterium]|nr:hypothetical protein [Saprospiraceae bacterium]
MRTVLTWTTKIRNEILIILGLILLVNVFFGKIDITIKSDGAGYYDYLPSLFIHHDLIRYNSPYTKDSSKYHRIIAAGNYSDYNNSYKVNKYPVGVAIFELPFFIGAMVYAYLNGDPVDGFSMPFQKSIYYCALFYLFWIIYFLKKFLKLYQIDDSVILLCQALIVFATPLMHYTYFDMAFSHLYSLLSLLLFLYCLKIYFDRNESRYLFFASGILGLVFLCRPPNLIIFFFIPFLLSSFSDFANKMLSLIKNWKLSLSSSFIFLSMASILPLVWFLQTKSVAVDSYPEEHFNLLSPHFYSILFSYRKGLFVYTPLLLVSMLCVLWLLVKVSFYSFITWTLFFSLLTYVLSSWWSWYYGASFGLRAYVDYLIIFMIPLGLFVNSLKGKLRSFIMICCIPFVVLNVIQTYQYKQYILHWGEMDKKKYWSVFCETSREFIGLVWKSKKDTNQFKMLYEKNIMDDIFPKKSTTLLFEHTFNDSLSIDQVKFVQLQLENDFYRRSKSRILLTVVNAATGENYIYSEHSLIQFYEEKLNLWHKGSFDFTIEGIPANTVCSLKLHLIAGDFHEQLSNIRVKFYGDK